jgi:glycosyltransferase involved in cell wall biosynthesis
LVRHVEVVELPYHSKSALARGARNVGRLLRGSPPLLDRFSEAHRLAAAVLRGRRYAVSIVEHFWCAPYWEEIAPVSGRTILDLHNIESVLHARCAQAERPASALAHTAFSRCYARLERRWAPQFDEVLVPSGADAARMRALTRRVVVFPNAIPAQPAPLRARARAIAFSANFEYHPNSAAVAYFAREIWPILRDRHADLEWRLIGRNAHMVAARIRHDPRIRPIGPVEDAVAELAAAQLAVVPILAGSGTRFKILEAWAAATPVISTSMGAEGLPAAALLVEDSPAKFADAVSWMLADAEAAARLGAAGRAEFEQNFTWPAAWRLLDKAW